MFRRYCTLTYEGVLTDRYDLFVVDKTNRKLTEKHILEVSKSKSLNVKAGEYPFQAPIVCYWDYRIMKLVITQGCHRFSVCKREKRIINFVITHHIMPASQAQITRGQDWKTEELVYSYARQKNKHYELLLELYKKYPEYSVIALTAIINGHPTKTIDIRDGIFEVEGELREVREIAERRIQRYEQFLLVTNRSDRGKELITALIQGSEDLNFDWNYFLERARINSKQIMFEHLKTISTSAQARSLITLLYNTNSKRKNFYYAEKRKNNI